MILHTLLVRLGLPAQKKYAHGPLNSIHSLQKTLYLVIRLSWERPKLPMPSLFLGQTEACGGEKNYFNLRSDLPLIVGIRWVGLVPPLLVDLNLPVLLIFAAHECLKLSLFSRKELEEYGPFCRFLFIISTTIIDLFLSAHFLFWRLPYTWFLNSLLLAIYLSFLTVYSFTVYFRIVLNWLTLHLLGCHQL